LISGPTSFGKTQLLISVQSVSFVEIQVDVVDVEGGNFPPKSSEESNRTLGDENGRENDIGKICPQSPLQRTTAYVGPKSRH